MFYENKYLTIHTDKSPDDLPEFYIGIDKFKANLKYFFESNASLNFSFGAFYKSLFITFKWGHISREMTEREKETREKARKFWEDLDE